MLRTLLCLLLLIPALAAVPSAHAQHYPDRPIRLVIPFAPGGGADTLGRALAENMAPRLAQPIVVDNRSGGNGNIGVDAVAKAAPDGYTIVLALSSNLLVNQFLFSKLPFNAQTDIALVAKVADAPLVFVVSDRLGIQNPADLRRYVAAHKRKLSYGSWGIGTISHLSGGRMSELLAGEMTHIPYRGEVPMMQDLLGGLLPMSFATGASARQFVQAGRLRALGVTGTSRVASLPDVPTLVEAGFDDPVLRAVGWIAVAAPARTPQAVIERLSREIKVALADPAVQQRIQQLGWTPAYLPPREFADAYRRELPLWQSVVKNSGVTLD